MKLLFFQISIIVPFLAGVFLKNRLRAPLVTAKKIVRANLVALEPVIALWSLWGLSLEAAQAVLPIGGLLVTAAGLFFGVACAPLLGLKGKRRVTFHISAALANHGMTMGGFFCYLLMGEEGLAMSFLFLVYFLPFVFIVIFPYARNASDAAAGTRPRVRDFIFDGRNMPLAGILLALALKFFGFRRPEVPLPFDLLILISVAVYYFTLGITVSVKTVRKEVPSLVFLSAIKFFLVPLTAIAATSLFGIGHAVRGVIILESFMPAAVYSVITAVVFDLDNEMASVLFLLNTAIFLALIMPLILAFGGAVI